MGKLVRRLERKRKTRLRNTPFTDEWSAAQRKKKPFDIVRGYKDKGNAYAYAYRQSQIGYKAIVRKVRNKRQWAVYVYKKNG